MSARSARILLALLLLAPAAEAGWFGGDGYRKKLPKAIKMVEIRPHDAKRLTKPAKVLSSVDPRLDDSSWGGPGPVFYGSQRMRASHQNKD